MITFDYLTLFAFYSENENFFKGAKIQKIQQPTRRELILSLRKADCSKKLYININPQFYHTSFMSKIFDGRRNIKIPKNPPMFCMLLRKYIENATIIEVKVPKYERILEFYIETYNEIAEKIKLCLAVEFMGKYSNIILYRCDNNMIIGCAHNVGEDKSRVRELAGNLKYVYPKIQNKSDIKSYVGTINYLTLEKNFCGFSKHLQDKCNGLSLNEIKEMFELKNISPNIDLDYKEYFLFNPKNDSKKINTVSDMIEDYYSFYIEKYNIEALKNLLYSKIVQKIKKDKITLSKLETQIIKSKNLEKYKLYGNLILANLYNGKDFENSIKVFDYENSKEIEIKLDNTKTLKANAGKYYKLYTKSKSTVEKSKEYFEITNADLIYQEQLKYSVDIAKNINELMIIKDEIMPEKSVKKVEKSSNEPDKIEIDGNTVFIGKNNRQNDYIVSKLAKDNDYWFHVKDCAGSHVLLKCQEPSDEILLTCAKLAKEFSSASKSSTVGVIYTKAKNLKKPIGANLGYVIYKGEKEIVL